MEIIKWLLIISIVIFACFQIYGLIKDVRNKVTSKKNNKINEKEVKKDDVDTN